MNTYLRSSKTKLALAVTAMTLAACTGALGGGVTVSRVDVASNYVPDELYVVASGQNQLRTRIIGDPFGMPKAAFDHAVLASLKGQNFGPPLNLSTNPTHEDARKRQVVIAFNLADVARADRLCTEATEPTAPAHAGGPLTVTGVYCAGGDSGYLTQATARSDNVTSADSPQFRQLMTQLAIALFPDENPRRNLDEGQPPPIVP